LRSVKQPEIVYWIAKSYWQADLNTAHGILSRVFSQMETPPNAVKLADCFLDAIKNDEINVWQELCFATICTDLLSRSGLVCDEIYDYFMSVAGESQWKNVAFAVNANERSGLIMRSYLREFVSTEMSTRFFALIDATDIQVQKSKTQIINNFILFVERQAPNVIKHTGPISMKHLHALELLDLIANYRTEPDNEIIKMLFMIAMSIDLFELMDLTEAGMLRHKNSISKLNRTMNSIIPSNCKSDSLYYLAREYVDRAEVKRTARILAQALSPNQFSLFAPLPPEVCCHIAARTADFLPKEFAYRIAVSNFERPPVAAKKL